MAHTFDTNLLFTGSTSPVSSNYTCGVGSTLLCLGIVTKGNIARTGGAPTYNGAALTQADETRLHGTSAETSCELWYLIDPPTNSSYVISVPNASSQTIHIQASSYKARSGYSSALDTSNGKTASSGTSVVINLTLGTSSSLILSVVGYGYPIPATRGRTILNATNADTYSYASEYNNQTLTGAYPVTWTGSTSDDWCSIAAVFSEVVSGNKTLWSIVREATLALKAPVPQISVYPDTLTLALEQNSVSITGLEGAALTTTHTIIHDSLSLASTLYAPTATNGTVCNVSPNLLIATLTLNAPSVIIDRSIAAGVTTNTELAIVAALETDSLSVTRTSSVTATMLPLSFDIYPVSIKSVDDVIVTVNKLSITAAMPTVSVLKPLPVVRMISFIYSSDIAYACEFGDEYIRFFYNSAPLLNSAGNHVEVTTPYQNEDLLQLCVRQIADTMWITHPSYAPRKLTRTTATSFALTAISFEKGPFLTRNDIANDDEITLESTETVAGTSATITASESLFASGHVGALFSLTHPRVRLKTSGTLTGTTTGIIGEPIDVLGDYIFTISSTGWRGTVEIQRSTDNGLTYTAVSGASHSNKNNSTTTTGTEIVEGVRYRIYVTAHTSGTITASLVVNDSTIAGTATTNGIIKVPLNVPKGDFTFNTHGTWAGTIVLERNVNEAGWEAYRTYVGDSDRNIQYTGTETEDNVQYRINVTNYQSGTMKADLTASASTQTGVVKITAVTSSTIATATVLSDLGSEVSTKRWAEGAWSDVRGYPASVTFFEDRAIYAGNTSGINVLPETTWVSASGDYDNFSEGTDDDEGFNLGVPSTNTIRWIDAVESLLVGTAGDEWKIGTNKLEGYLTPTTFAIKQQLSYGSKSIQPVRVNEVLLYVDSSGRRIRECVFSDEKQKYISPDLTALAEHITFSGIAWMAYQKNPDPILWCGLNDGTLTSMVYCREQNVIAWSKHPMEGLVQSGCVLPGDEEDELWLSIVRAVNGSTEVYIEQLQPRWWGNSLRDAFFVDSGVTYSGTATTSLTGYDHLEHKKVSILGDGVAYNDLIVEGGEITSPVAVKRAIGGLPYTSKLQPMRLDFNTSSGSTHGGKKKIFGLILSFKDTMNTQYGDSNSNLYDIDWTNSEWINKSTITGLFTGDIPVTFDGGFSIDDPIIISHNDPLPMTLRAIIAQSDVTS